MMAWASAQKTGSPTRKAVLLALANRVNHDTGQCNPSIEAICAETEYGPTAVKKALADLVEAGFIERKRNRRGDGSLGTYTYTFPLQPRGGQPGPPGDPRPQPPGVPLNQEVPEPGTATSLTTVRDVAVAPPYDPRKGVKVEGRNLPWDALVAETQADERVEAGRIAAALRVIRAVMTEDNALGVDPHVPPEMAERLIAQEIRRRAARYRHRWPGVELTPTALAANWSRVMTQAPGEPDLERTEAAVQAGIDAARAARGGRS
jgi:hypothetical protein